MAVSKPNPISAYIGIAGALCMGISDVILLSVPAAGWQSDMASYSSLAHIAFWRMKVGPLIGWVSSFFICFGFWYIRQMLAHLGERLSMAMFVALSAMIVYGGGFHAAYYFAGHAEYVGQMDLYHAFIAQLEIMSYISAVGLVIGTGIYYYLLGYRPNGFPRWLKFTNLLVLEGLFLGIFMVLPAPVGGIVKPTFINLATLTFFVINLLVTETG
jgi:hypothetical protein